MGMYEILRDLTARRTRLVVISGGEPLLQRRGLLPLVVELLMTGKAVEIETNGTQAPLDLPTQAMPLTPHYNVSPKLANSGIDKARRIDLDVLRLFAPLPSVLKFVAEGPEDFDEMDGLVVGSGFNPGRVWVQPQARTREELAARTEALIDGITVRNYNLSGRLHVMAWGDRRGV